MEHEKVVERADGQQTDIQFSAQSFREMINVDDTLNYADVFNVSSTTSLSMAAAKG